MENLEIKDIVNVNNIKEIKTEFNNLINNLEKSKKNSIVNYIFEDAFFCVQFWILNILFLIISIDVFKVFSLTSFFIVGLISFFIITTKLKFNSVLKNIKFKPKNFYSFIKNKKLSTNNINIINNFFDSLNEKNKNIINNILDNKLIKENESDIAYHLLFKKIKTLSIKKIRDDKDIIFDFIKKEVKEMSKKTEMLDYLEERLKELTVSERVERINNTFKNPESINIEQNKNLIKSI
tara:strand:- start:9413 stop:10123 length:711 start_codon:yes stop_codon:yes gene_type:complete